MRPNGPTKSQPVRLWRRVVDLRCFVATTLSLGTVMNVSGCEERMSGAGPRCGEPAPGSGHLTVKPCSLAYATTSACRASAAAEPVVDPSLMAAICFVSAE